MLNSQIVKAHKIVFKCFPGYVVLWMVQRYVNSKCGGFSNYQIKPFLFPRSWPTRFNSSDIHRPVSTQDF